MKRNCVRRPDPIGFWTKSWYAWHDEEYKLLRKKGDESAWELYRLDEDPYEKNDIASGSPEIVEKMRGRLNRWIESCKASREGKDYAE